jgi:hypothetical protein
VNDDPCERIVVGDALTEQEPPDAVLRELFVRNDSQLFEDAP